MIVIAGFSMSGNLLTLAPKNMSNKDNFLSEYHKDLGAIVELSRQYILRREINYPSHLNKSEQQALEQLRQKFTLLIRSIFEIRSVVEDIEMTYWMSRRYPWQHRKIKKPKHLELTWFLFVNLCYLFREKIKRYHNNFSDCCKIFDFPQPNWLNGLLKEIQKELGKHIKFRGQTVHEWNEYNFDIKLYSMVDLLETEGIPNEFCNSDDHYSNAKFIISYDINKAAEAARKIYYKAIEVDQNMLIKLVETFNSVMGIKLDPDESQNVRITVVESQKQ